MVYCAPCVAKSEPLLNLSTLPMLASTFDEAATLHRIARPYYSAALARHGQMLLATQPWIPGALWSTFPIRSVADLKGVPFAVVATPGASDIESGWGRPFARLGARSVSFSEAEVVIASAHLGHMLKLTQQFAYFTEIFFAVPLTFQAARQDVFEFAIGDGATGAPWSRSRHRACAVETHEGTAAPRPTRDRRSRSTGCRPTSCRRPGSIA